MIKVMQYFRKNIYGIFVILVLSCVLLVPAVNVNSAFYVSLIPNILFLALYLYQKEIILTVLHQMEKKDIALSVIGVLAFLLLLPCSSILKIVDPEIGDAINLRIVIYIYVAVLAINLFICFLVLFGKSAEQTGENKTENGGKPPLPSRVFSNFADYKQYFCLIAAVTLLVDLAAYPGQLKSDGYNVWRQVIGESVWSDWHDVGYVFFVWICTRIWENPFMAILGQTLIWIYVNTYVLNYLNRYKGKLSCKIYTISLFVVGTMFHYIKVLYKDTIFSIAMLGFTITFLAYINGERNAKTVIQLIFFGILTASVRHMMIIPVAVGLTAGIICWFCQKKRKECLQTIFVLGITVTLFGGIRYAILQVSDAQENPPYVKYSMPLQMMAAYANTGEVDEATRKFMEQYLPVEQWAAAYQRDNYMSDYISREWCGIITAEQLNSIAEHGMEILKINWRFLTQNPQAYLKAFFKQNSLVWRMSEIDGYPVMLGPGFDNEGYKGEYGEAHPELFADGNYLTEMLEPIIVMMFNNPLWKSVVWHSGLYLIVLLIGIIISIRKKEAGYVCAAVPIITVDIMLMLTLPAQDPRYILPTIQVGILYFAVFEDEFFRKLLESKIENCSFMLAVLLLCVGVLAVEAIKASATDESQVSNGWALENNEYYWYENGAKQGLEGRGKEIYDPESDAWYWLDAVQGGAKAVNKDVYQESEAGIWADREDGTGKWVRYDENGHMVKGWQTTEAGVYYFDTTYGTMAKGAAVIDGEEHYFNPDTGIMEW